MSAPLTTGQRARPDRNLPENIEERVKQLPGELLPVYRKLSKLSDRQAQSDLMYYYRIGQFVRKQYDALKEINLRHHHRQGVNQVFSQLAAALNRHPRLLHDCLALVNAFDEADFQQHVLANYVNWSQLRIIARRPTRMERLRLLRRVAEEQLTAEQLAAEIMGSEGSRRRGSGRRPAPPKNLKHAIGRNLTGLTRYQNLLDSLYGESYDLPSAVCASPPDELTDVTKAQLEELTSKGNSLVATLRRNAAELNAAIRHIENVLAVRERQEQELQAESLATSIDGRERCIDLD